LTTVLCDLDGVVYRGSRVLPGAAAALERLMAEGVDLRFITNNSTRTPEATADKISGLTGLRVSGDQVLTSAQAAMTLLGAEDAPVLVVGEEGLRSTVETAGLAITTDPSRARSVVVGLTRDLSYGLLTDAMRAIGNGARFVATNTDSTFPNEDGLAPGCGAIVAAISVATGLEPEVAGKPHPAMRDLISRTVDGEVWVIGDRVDTDIAMASLEPNWRSVLVLSGITDREAAANSGADHLASDLEGAVDVVLASLERS
jgi:glycerol-1-phosphatase